MKFWALPFFEKWSIKCSTHLYFEFNSHHFHRGNRSFSLQVSSTVAYFVVKELNYFPRVAITNYYKLPFKKHRNLFPNISGGHKSEVRVSAGHALSQALRRNPSRASLASPGGCQQSCHSVSSRSLTPVFASLVTWASSFCL